MFLHSAAGLHRHEYSNAESTDNRWNSLPRTLLPPLSMKRSMSTSQTSPRPVPSSYSDTPGLPRRFSTFDKPISTRPNIPSRPLSDLLPRTGEAVVRFIELDPDQGAMSEDGRSVANSETSETTAGGRKRRQRSTRSATTYHLAHPAPTLTQKQKLLQIRPKLLLQLQRISIERPKPAIDVLPSTVVVPRLIKKFPRMFRGKAMLGANDAIIVKSEDYDTSSSHPEVDGDSDEECLENREIMAVICQLAQGRAEIVLDDGSVWLATPLPNGRYEFVTKDGSGNEVRARWFKKAPRKNTAGTASTADGGFKFSFSIIDPKSRRHPIMASLTQSALKIPDAYISVSSSAGKCPPTSPIRYFPGDPEWQAPVDEPHGERTSNVIDENMRKLIQVTGIWVALRQGLSPYFKYDAVASTSSTVQRNGSVGSRIRGIVGTGEAGWASPVGTSTPESSIFGGRIASLGKCVKKGSPSSNASAQTDNGLPKRSFSTGAAYMQRATARRAGILPSTVASESEGEGVFTPPKRAATEESPGSAKKELSTSHHRSLPGSSATPILDTPTKPGRRFRSVHVTNGVHQRGHRSTERSSVEFADGQQCLDSGEKSKTGRWRAVKEFFRRSHTRSG